ncbi:MAG: radical SAM protein [Nanoarchaeota archaeon]|nr:radical SAM protein [Nanoarchaeota archaeon]
MEQVTIQFTENCNLQCSHCYLSCGLQGRTMDKNSLEKVLQNIPENTKHVVFTGGEPFVEKDTLMHALYYMRINSILPKARIHVHTNGFWIKDDISVYRVLRQLRSFRVSGLVVTSRDSYHKEQGIDTEKLGMHSGSPIFKGLEMLATAVGISRTSGRLIRVNVPNARKPLPFGRAKLLPEESLRNYSECDARAEKIYNVTISPDGNAYPCCWRQTPSIGSAVETPIEVLAEEAKKNEVFAALIKGGPMKAAEVLGAYDEKDKARYQANPCVECERIFKDLR